MLTESGKWDVGSDSSYLMITSTPFHAGSLVSFPSLPGLS